MMFRNKVAFFADDYRVKKNYFITQFDENNAYKLLVSHLTECGYIVNTLDVFNKKNIIPDICLFLDIPLEKVSKYIPSLTTTPIALLREADMILSRNYDKQRHSEFEYILTWKEELVDESKYFYCPSTKIQIKNNLIETVNEGRSQFVLINSNLHSNVDGELYSERLRVAKWFQDNRPNDFELWGVNWDKRRVSIFKKNLITYPSKYLKSVYKGVCNNKHLTLQKYKFCICFENTRLIKDYISEKIFDCFLAGCVPIYYGDPDITKKIPSKCFIDYRNYSGIEEMYDQLTNMTDSQYEYYLSSIADYIISPEAQRFTLKNWIQSITQVIRKASLSV